MNPSSTISARTRRSFKAALVSLIILSGIISVNPQSSWAATPIVKGGAALVTNTDGSTVRVRSGAGTDNAQVAEAHEGEVVGILDGPTKDSGGNTWYKVSAPGGKGWVISDYLQGKSVSMLAGGAALIANAGSDTIRVRSGAGTDNPQVAEAHEGESVTILDGPTKDSGGNTWYKVSAPGGTGWVISDYLQGTLKSAAAALGTGGSGTGSSSPAKGASGIFAGGKATIANTGGDPVRVHTGAGTDYSLVTEAHEGDTVSVLDGPSRDSGGNTWYKVSAPGGKGWVINDYLAAASSGSGSSNTRLQSPAVSNSSGPKLSGSAKVGNSDGDPVRLRKAASSSGSIITLFQPDTSLAIKQGPVSDDSGTTWYQVSGNGQTGWMMAQYLVQSDAPVPAPAPASAPVSAQAPQAPQAPVAQPAIETKPAAPAAPPAAAPAPAAPSAPQAPAPPAAQAPAPAPAAPAPARTKPQPQPQAQPQAQAAPAAKAGYPGNSIVSLALKYVGAAYSMGGVGPRAFDCSGFVYYVLNHSGVSMSRDMYAQWSSGPHISSSDLQPGDLLFFSNTYKRGLSHVAIYIGNGKMVHAENYGTGVTVGNLWDSYYKAHYTGAVRPSR